MKCPKCEDRSLQSTTVRGVEVDRCSDCRGVWFDANELTLLLDLPSRELRSLQSGTADEALNRKPGRCPRDGAELLRVYSAANHDVVLDTCSQCNGIWLDGGELKRLTDH